MTCFSTEFAIDWEELSKDIANQIDYHTLVDFIVWIIEKHPTINSKDDVKQILQNITYEINI